MPYGQILADAIVDSNGAVFSPSSSLFKNRIINGAMVIDQRRAGASVTPTSTNTYTLDRWSTLLSVTSKFSVQQNAGSVTPPAGFTNYLGITSLSAYTVLTGDYFSTVQYIEGYNISDLAWGTANAATVTLSFWVRSSLTGTFGGALRNGAGTRSYPFTYTISSANTWTQISITIAGDTSGTWVSDNTSGLGIQFGLGVGATYSGTAGSWAGTLYVSATGATSVVGTSGATFYITGVQLEKGSTATSFDYRPYGTELSLCQRYYQIVVPSTGVTGSGFINGTTQLWTSTPFKTTMRAFASVSITGTISGVTTTWSGSSIALTSYTVSTANTDSTSFYGIVASGLTTGQGGFLTMGASNQLVASAEL